MTDKEDFASLLDEMESGRGAALRPDPGVGEKVTGRVVSVGEETIFVDLGTKSEGSIDRREFTDEAGQLTVGVGDRIETTVVGRDEQTGTLTLGSGQGQRPHGAEELQRAFQFGLPVEGLVTGVAKGGVEVQIAGLRAFCPASQLDIRFIDAMEAFVGEHLTFRITDYSGGRHANLVVSRRALLEEEQRERAAKTRAALEVGAILEGTVTAIKDYGAFVDIGGIEGMVHISELAFGRVEHPGELLKVGQQVEVAVLRIEKSDNPRHPEKIALSIRATAPDPWETAAEAFPEGARVAGTVTRIQPFGAFVELAPGIEGLVHVSEMDATRRVRHPGELLNPGDRVEARVLAVDLPRRRISLSLKTAAPADDGPAAAEDLSRYKAPATGFGTLGDLLRESLKKGR